MDWDTLFLALRVVVALAAVFGALWYAHRWITKGRPGSAPRARQISVVSRQGIGAKAGVAIVDAGGRRYLLGVTEHAVNVLDTLGEAPEPEPEPEPALPGGGAARLAALRAGRFGEALRSAPAVRAVAVAGALPVVEQPGDDPATGAAEPAPPARWQGSGPLAGSVLSPATWRQTVAALKRAR